MEKITCTTCNMEKSRKVLKYVQRGEKWSRPVYVDETGRQWNYKQCPDCKYAKNGEYKVKNTNNKRKCRKCGGFLAVNYFYHNACLEKTKDDIQFAGDDYIYG